MDELTEEFLKLKLKSKNEKTVGLIKNYLETVLNYLRSTDLSIKSGLNETGLKALVISWLAYNMDERSVSIHSEFPLHLKYNNFKISKEDRYTDATLGGINGNLFTDIMIETETQIVIIELKYLKIEILKGYSLKDKKNRISFSESLKKFNKLTEDDILKHEAYDFNTGSFKKIEVLFEDAITQNKKYINRAQSIWKNKKVNGITIMSVVNKVLTPYIIE